MTDRSSIRNSFLKISHESRRLADAMKFDETLPLSHSISDNVLTTCTKLQSARPVDPSIRTVRKKPKEPLFPPITPSRSSVAVVAADGSKAGKRNADETIFEDENADETTPINLQEILDAMLPPEYRIHVEDGQRWAQPVSAFPATRLDVISLSEQLDRQLKTRQAKPFGVCPIRRELYDQVFDEIIRQVTVGCAERGLLLLRVRDEIRLSMHAYECLHESAVAYGLRKAIELESKKYDCEDRLKELTAKRTEMQEEILELNGKLRRQKVIHDEQRAAMEKFYEDEMGRLNKCIEQLKMHIEVLVIPSETQPSTNEDNSSDDAEMLLKEIRELRNSVRVDAL